MKRRRVVALIGSALALPRMALAQTQRVRRIGVLAVGVASAEQQQMGRLLLVSLMTKAGFEEGRNVEYEWRWAEGDAARLPALAEALIGLKPDVIVASFNPAIHAAQRATRTIPVVMFNAIGKFLETLREAAPQARRVAVIGNPNYPGERHYRAAALAAGTVSFVARILNGAKAADLPVELPSRYRLIVSKRTAAAIGHRLLQSLLLRADQVIE